KPLCIGLNRAMPPPPLFYRVVKLWQIAGRFSGEIWVFLQPQRQTSSVGVSPLCRGRKLSLFFIHYLKDEASHGTSPLPLFAAYAGTAQQFIVEC
ncbi:MAG: hypothetical protein PHU06_14675, partial [Gallionella sp.]|nr:hypothetical protein [Gallionella sp.]